MKLKLLLIGIALSAASCSSQAPETLTIDFANYSKPKSFFANKVAAAQKDGKWGWINLYGEWIIPTEYDERPADWESGLCSVRKNGLYGIINTANEVIVPLEYERPLWIHSAKETVGHTAYISTKKDDEIIFFNAKGEMIESEPERLVEHNTLCFTSKIERYLKEADSKVVNHKGETLLEFAGAPFICWVGEFHNGMAPFFIAPFDGGSANLAGGLTYYGYVNEDGELVIPVQFVANYLKMQWSNWNSDRRMQFEDGQALVKSEQQYALINQKGEIVKELPASLGRIDTVSGHGLRETSIGWINKSGELIYESTEAKWKFVERGFNSNGFAVMSNGQTKQFKVVNHKMEEIYSQAFFDDDYTYWLTPFNDTFFKLRKGSNEMFKKKGMDHYTATYSGLGEIKYIKYTGGESEWMEAEPGRIADAGLLVSGPIMGAANRTVTNTENQTIFACDSCELRYFGNDQYNNRGKWALEARDANGSVEIIGLNGFQFADHTDNFENKFTNLDKGIVDVEKDYPNFNFTLKFDESKVQEIYDEIFSGQ